MGRRAYVVRDADVGTDTSEVTQIYAYTLKGLTTALEDARFRVLGTTGFEVLETARP
jgi:hypothetical protein